jgi:FkbM family methyltransferase
MTGNNNIKRILQAFNTSPIWRSKIGVWGQTMMAASFDRWLYLRLHRIGRMGNDERSTLQKFVKPGMTILDVGSNIGLYTIFISKLVGPNGKVIAFEPDPELYSLLRQNCELNNCTNVESYNLALSDRQDRLTLRKQIFNSGDNTLGSNSSDRFRQNVEIEAVAIDEFLPNLRPSLVKIDVQGWELKALSGMQRMLTLGDGIDVFFEFWPDGFHRAGYGADDLTSFLHKLDFQISMQGFAEGRPLTKEEVSSLARKLTGIKYTNLYASRRSRVKGA